MRRKGVSYSKYGYFFSIPFIAVFLTLSLWPIIYTVMISFTDLRNLGNEFGILRTTDGAVNLFGNFSRLFGDKVFWQSLFNTCLIWILNFIPQMAFALLLAAWFTSRRINIKGTGAFKVLFYMPNIITAATIAILFNVMFSYPNGIVNDIIKFIHSFNCKPPTDPELLREVINRGDCCEAVHYGGALNFLQMKPAARNIIAFIQFWMWYGYTMLILISGILGINPELYEASEIDGCSTTQTFFQITLPNLRTIMIFTLVTSLIGGMQMFDIPMLFNEGRPDNSTMTTSLYIYRAAFRQPRMNVAAAASLFMFAIIAVLSVGVFYLMRDKHEAKEKKKIKAQQKAVKS